MVGSFGMAGSLISLEALRAPGGANIVAKVLADETCRAEVDAILDAARDDVRSLLAQRSYLVEALRDALLQRDELLGAEISAVLDGAEADRQAQIVDLRDQEVYQLGLSSER
jgi:hypothetical protein